MQTHPLIVIRWILVSLSVTVVGCDQPVKPEYGPRDNVTPAATSPATGSQGTSDSSSANKP